MRLQYVLYLHTPNYIQEIDEFDSLHLSLFFISVRKFYDTLNSGTIYLV